MRNGLILACLIFGLGCDLYAQATAPVDVSVCDVVKKPQAFNGQIVRIKGTVVAGFDGAPNAYCSAGGLLPFVKATLRFVGACRPAVPALTGHYSFPFQSRQAPTPPVVQ